MENEVDVHSLLKFANEAGIRLSKLLARLGWSEDDVKKDKQHLKQCPYEGHHRIPSDAFDAHIRRCHLKSQGIDAKKQIVLPSSSFAYERAAGVVRLQATGPEISVPQPSPYSFPYNPYLLPSNAYAYQTYPTYTQSPAPYPTYPSPAYTARNYPQEPLQVQVVQKQDDSLPCTSPTSSAQSLSSSSDSRAFEPIEAPRLVPKPTTAHKRALYEKDIELSVAVLQSRGVRELAMEADDLASGANREGSSRDADAKSMLELLKEQRDYKRRRQTYRAKNVHITKRTPTQVLHDIIEQRMIELGASPASDQSKHEEEQGGFGEEEEEEERKARKASRDKERRRN